MRSSLALDGQVGKLSYELEAAVGEAWVSALGWLSWDSWAPVKDWV